MTASFRAAITAALFSVLLGAPGPVIGYSQTDLITNATDPDLKNPWGISFGPTSPFWVSDNATGKATLYNGAGAKQGLIVTMPAGSEAVTGQVFSNSPGNFNSDIFLFATENGTITGWRGALGTSAEMLFDSTAKDAVYKGLAINDTKDSLYATDFHNGAVDLFNSAGLAGSFFDPTLPAGYDPFNIQNLGGTFYVTFAQRETGGDDDVSGTGHGVVDIFDPTTNTFTRLITGSAAGGTVDALDSPWGLALAPSTFGPFGNDLLIGNFGNGEINAFNPTTGTFLGTLLDSSNSPIVNPGLWGLAFGNANVTFDPNALYFTAGGANEDTGVFGKITVGASSVPEPTTFALLGVGLAALGFSRRARKP